MCPWRTDVVERYHSSDASLSSNVCGNTFECHDGTGTCFFRDASLRRCVSWSGSLFVTERYLLCIDDVHDDASLRDAGIEQARRG